MAKREIPARCCNCLRPTNDLHTGIKLIPGKGAHLTFKLCTHCLLGTRKAGPKMRTRGEVQQ